MRPRERGSGEITGNDAGAFRGIHALKALSDELDELSQTLLDNQHSNPQRTPKRCDGKTKDMQRLLRRTRETKANMRPASDTRERPYASPLYPCPATTGTSTCHHRRQSANTTISEESTMEPSPPFQFYSPPLTSQKSFDDVRLESTGIRGSRLFQDNGDSHGRSPQASTLKWGPAIENVKGIVQAKDEKILSLEDENSFLRSMLLQRQRRPTVPKEELGFTRRSQLSQDNPRAPDFTNGTQFVAELALMMDIEVGNHAPLSFIIDRHWDRLKRINQNKG